VLTGNEPLWPAFDILAGSVKVESGHRRTFDGRVARALVAAWKPPAGAQPGGSPPAGAIQSLWIDIDSTLPLRWTISVPGLPAEYSVAFTYDPALDLRLPAVGPPADCVP
jgi:hypothetical protein